MRVSIALHGPAGDPTGRSKKYEIAFFGRGEVSDGWEATFPALPDNAMPQIITHARLWVGDWPATPRLELPTPLRVDPGKTAKIAFRPASGSFVGGIAQ